MDTDTQQILTDSIGLLIRHGLTIAAGWLTAHSLLAATDQPSFVGLGAGILCGLVAIGWSYVQKKSQIAKVETLRAALRGQAPK